MAIEAQTTHVETKPTRTTSSREDVVDNATNAVAEYSHLVDIALSDTQPILYRALGLTYVAALQLLTDEHWLADFLEGKSTGPKSTNLFLPIVRKLWKGVLTRDSFRRYACCMALARESGVNPADFAEWIGKYPGGIKAAAAKWSNDQKKPEAQARVARDQKAETEGLIEKFTPVPLPAEIGTYQPDLHLALVRVTTDHKAEMITVFDQLTRAEVDAFIAKVLR